MSDVSALVLSIGETYTGRAIASLETQTLPPTDVIVVENVSPFSSAMNAGIRRVKSSFFVQVDADMVLDSGCFEALRAAATDDAGMVVGELRDPLMGQVIGVKLFRTECIERLRFRDSVSPDTDYVKDLKRIGMRVIYIGDPNASDDEPLPTFGDHLPEYAPAYTYRKFMIEGARLRYRGSRPGLKWRLRRLETSAHPLARLACVGMADGFFYPSDRDLLTPLTGNSGSDRITVLLDSATEDDQAIGGLLPLDPRAPLRELFRRFMRGGQLVAKAHAGRTARAVFASLREGAGSEVGRVVATIAFGRGLASPDRDALAIASDEAMMHRFITLGLGKNAGATDAIRARAARLGDVIGLRGPVARW